MAPALLIAAAMRAGVCFALVLGVACTQPHAVHETSCGGNLESCAVEGDSCDYQADHQPPGVCNCTGGHWICSSCPWATGIPSSACTAGDTCDAEDWEHGCDCVCSAAHGWSCSPETQGSTCPGNPVDAGVP